MADPVSDVTGAERGTAAPTPAAPTIVIEVSGGVVQAVYSDRLPPADVHVVVVDWDHHNDGDHDDRGRFLAEHAEALQLDDAGHGHRVDEQRFPHRLY